MQESLLSLMRKTEGGQETSESLWVARVHTGPTQVLQDKLSSGWDNAKRYVFNYEKSRVKIPDCFILLTV